MPTNADLAVASTLLGLAADLALRAANTASGVNADDSMKSRAEEMEELGDHVHELLKDYANN